MFISILRVCGGLGLFALMCPAQADTERLVRLSLEELLNVEVTTVSKAAERAEYAPATVYVITAEEIAALGLRDLQDVLALVAGVDTSDNDFFLQGGQRGFMGAFSQSLVLINGREMNNLIAGETFIAQQFRLHNVKQVEIVAGPGSALYGANAVGGVINLITYSPVEKEGVQVGLNSGAFGTQSVDVVFRGEVEGWKYAGAISRYASDGEDFAAFLSTPTLASPAAENNAYRHLPLQYGYENDTDALPISLYVEKSGFYAGLEYYRNRSGRGTASIQWDYNRSEDYREMLMSYVGYQDKTLWNDDLSIRAEYRQYWEQFWGNHTESVGGVENPRTGEIFKENVSLEQIEDFRGFYSNKRSDGSRKQVVLLEGIYYPNAEDTLVAGIDYEMSDIIGAAWSRVDKPHPPVSAAQMQPEFQNWKGGLYGQWQSHWWDKRLAVTLGARVAFHERYDTHVLPRGGLVWRASEDTLFKLLYGKSFREPLVFELLSNIAIQPMQMDTWEFAWHQYINPYFKNEIVVFFNQATDRIVSDDVLTITNGGVLDAHGVENILKFQYEDFSGFLNYTYMDTVRTTEQDIISEVYDIPRHKANLALIYTLAPKTTLGIVGRFRSKVETAYQDTLVPINGYTVWDVTLRQDLRDLLGTRAALSVSLKNVFDRTYYHPEPRDGNALQHPQEGRGLWLRLEWGW